MRNELIAIEQSGIYSNFGPVNARFEQAILEAMFGGAGACLTVSNATAGLMIAIQYAIGKNSPRRRYALMPSFTFAAAAQAALWNGLIPLFCDIDDEFWTPSADAEQALIERYRDEVAVIVPYATFGNGLDLARYQRLSQRYGVPVVVDAAASLGSTDGRGRGFGAGFPFLFVFSLHATKAFAAMEGGLIYSSDPSVLASLRAMSNFGFEVPRLATTRGLNAKMSEVHALLALAKLPEIGDVVARREAAARLYRARLEGWVFQRAAVHRQSHMFAPVLLPRGLRARRSKLVRQLAEEGVGVGTYFSPHLAEHPYFAATCVAGDLSRTEDIAGRILALPLSDGITPDEIAFVCDSLLRLCGSEGA
jgi:dTDP-4-amino-4,6-dideoxygalactose transaminase